METLFSPQFFAYLAATCAIGLYIWQRERNLKRKLGIVHQTHIIRQLESVHPYRYFIPFLFSSFFWLINYQLRSGFSLVQENPLGFILIVGALSSLKISSGMRFSESGIALGHSFEPWTNISHISWSPTKKPDMIQLDVYRLNSKIPFKNVIDKLDQKKVEKHFQQFLKNQIAE